MHVSSEEGTALQIRQAPSLAFAFSCNSHSASFEEQDDFSQEILG